MVGRQSRGKGGGRWIIHQNSQTVGENSQVIQQFGQRFQQFGQLTGENGLSFGRRRPTIGAEATCSGSGGVARVDLAGRFASVKTSW